MTLTLDDRVAIEALCHRYNVAADERDAATYVSLFTEDGVWDGPLGRYEGREALRRLIADIAATPALTGTRHWANNVAIDGDSAAGTARVSLDNLLARAGAEGPELFSLSRSVSRLVREDGEWRFAERTVTPHRAP